MLETQVRTLQKAAADYDPLLLFHMSTEDDARGNRALIMLLIMWGGGVKCMETPGSFLFNPSRKAEG